MSAKHEVPELSPTPPRTLRQLRWVLALLAIAGVEVIGSAVVQGRVPEETSWREAAEYVRDEWQDGDLAVAAPLWADPLVRLHMGDLIGVEDAGRADLAPYERIWEFSIRGARSTAARGDAAETIRFGRVTVNRYDLGPSPVLVDLTSRIGEAEVDVQGRACTKQRRAFEGGGLFRGPAMPTERFFCGPAGWQWVGATVTEDLNMQNRYCIWQHPQDQDVPTQATFRDVELGDEIVLHAGLYYDHERRLENGPVTVQVLVDGEEVGRLTHRDGDGWERMVADPTPMGEDKERGDVSIVVSAPNPSLRTLCWAASTRRASERDDEEER